MTQETIDLVHAFYEDDEYSRQLLGKKDYVSIQKGVHKQKWLVPYNLLELFVAIKRKNPRCENWILQVSYSPLPKQSGKTQDLWIWRSPFLKRKYLKNMRRYPDFLTHANIFTIPAACLAFQLKFMHAR